MKKTDTIKCKDCFEALHVHYYVFGYNIDEMDGRTIIRLLPTVFKKLIDLHDTAEAFIAKRGLKADYDHFYEEDCNSPMPAFEAHCHMHFRTERLQEELKFAPQPYLLPSEVVPDCNVCFEKLRDYYHFIDRDLATYPKKKAISEIEFLIGTIGFSYDFMEYYFTEKDLIDDFKAFCEKDTDGVELTAYRLSRGYGCR